MFLLCLGILIGMFVSATLEPLLLWFLFKKRDKPHVRGVVTLPSDLHVELLRGAVPTCANLCWFNILLQRFLLEVTPSYAYKERIKRSFYKKTVKMKKFCDLVITDLDFGPEFPVLKRAKVVTKDEVTRILAGIKKKRKTDFVLNNDLRNLTDAEKELMGKTDSDVFFEDTSVSDFGGDEVNFDNLMVLFDMEYNGVYSIDCLLKLPNNIELSVKFELHNITGPLLVRLPALYNHTRVEVSLLNIDRLEFRIESAIKNKYLKKTATSIINKYFTTLLKSTYIYPKFYSKYIPSMIPSFKEVDYSFSGSLNEQSAEKYTHDICMFMSMDYKVVSIKNDVIMRKSNYYVTKTKDRLEMAEVCISDFLKGQAKENILNLANEQRWENNTEDVGSAPDETKDRSSPLNNSRDSSMKYLRKKKVADNACLESFYELLIRDLDIFKDTISDFVEVKNLKEHRNHTKVVIVFKDRELLFNRIDADKAVIFQSDTTPEFFAFKVRKLQSLEIFSYLKDFKITQTLVLAIKKKLESTTLMALKKKTYVRRADEKDGNVVDRAQINKIIFELNECVENKKSPDEELSYIKVKDIRINTDIKRVLEHLQTDYRTRFKLLLESFEIRADPKRLENILNYVIFHDNQPLSLYSYSKDAFIVDIIDEKRLIGYCAGDKDDILRLFYVEEIQSQLFHAFMFGIKAFIRIEQYLSESFILEKTFVDRVKYEGKFLFDDHTSLCVEFNVNIDDEIYFQVYDATRRKYTFEKIKILGKVNRLCRFILPIQTASTQIVTFKSKHDPLSNNLKISRVNSSHDTLIDSTIELSHGKKYKYYFQGRESYSFYWDLDESEIQAFYLTDDGLLNARKTGLMLMKNGSYGICLTNKSGAKRSIDVKIGSLFIER